MNELLAIFAKFVAEKSDFKIGAGGYVLDAGDHNL
jgi:hypothetical protein